MNFQSAVDKTTADKVFRAVVNANTLTATITARTIAIGSPIILATHSDSNNGQYVTRPATSTSLVNNLLVGNVAHAAGTVAYAEAEAMFIAQVYGIDDDAIVQTLTTTSLPGQVLIPESLQFLIPGVGPVTAASTGTAANVEQPAIGGLMYLLQSIASSSATSTGTAKVFLRCL
jgi:hypothetical protein